MVSAPIRKLITPPQPSCAARPPHPGTAKLNLPKSAAQAVDQPSKNNCIRQVHVSRHRHLRERKDNGCVEGHRGVLIGPGSTRRRPRAPPRPSIGRSPAKGTGRPESMAPWPGPGTAGEGEARGAHEVLLFNGRLISGGLHANLLRGLSCPGILS